MSKAGFLLRKLEAERLRRGVSQKEFAALIGMPPSNYTKYKKGTLTFDPLLSTLERFARGLEITVADLLTDEPRQPAPLTDEQRAALELADQVQRLVREADKGTRR